MAGKKTKESYYPITREIFSVHKWSFSGTQPFAFVYILTVSAFRLSRQRWVVETETIWPFTEKVCWVRGWGSEEGQGGAPEQERGRKSLSGHLSSGTLCIFHSSSPFTLSHISVFICSVRTHCMPGSRGKWLPGAQLTSALVRFCWRESGGQLTETSKTGRLTGSDLGLDVGWPLWVSGRAPWTRQKCREGARLVSSWG